MCGRPRSASYARNCWHVPRPRRAPRLFSAVLTERLDHGSDRALVAEALADVAALRGVEMAPLAEHLLAHIADPDPRVRTALLRFIGHAQLATCADWVVERLAVADEREAAAAREALHALGRKTIGALVSALQSGPRATRNAVLARLQEMPVDEATLRDLLDREVEAIRLDSGVCTRSRAVQSPTWFSSASASERTRASSRRSSC